MGGHIAINIFGVIVDFYDAISVVAAAAEQQLGIGQTRLLGFPRQLEHLIPIALISRTRTFADLAIEAAQLGL